MLGNPLELDPTFFQCLLEVPDRCLLQLAGEHPERDRVSHLSSSPARRLREPRLREALDDGPDRFVLLLLSDSVHDDDVSNDVVWVHVPFVSFEGRW
jgi:hypothetical protein